MNQKALTVYGGLRTVGHEDTLLTHSAGIHMPDKKGKRYQRRGWMVLEAVIHCGTVLKSTIHSASNHFFEKSPKSYHPNKAPVVIFLYCSTIFVHGPKNFTEF